MTSLFTKTYFFEKISTYCSRNIDCALFCYRAFTSNLDHWTCMAWNCKSITELPRQHHKHPGCKRLRIFFQKFDRFTLATYQTLWIPPWLPLAYSSSHVFFFWNHKGIPHIRISWEHGHCKINFERFGRWKECESVDLRWSLI